MLTASSAVMPGLKHPLTSDSRELWFRASLAWQDILTRDDVSSALLTAHNAVNQVQGGTAHP